MTEVPESSLRLKKEGDMDIGVMMLLPFFFLGLVAFELWLAARIGRKAGFRRAWLFILLWVLIILTVYVSLHLLSGDREVSSGAFMLGLIPLYYFAFKKWPALEAAASEETEADQKGPKPITPK